MSPPSVGTPLWQASRAVLLPLALSAAGVIVGLWIALAGLAGGLLVASAVVLAAGLVLPWRALLLGSTAVVMVLVGPLQYGAGFGKAYWLPYGLALLWWVRLLAHAASVAPASGTVVSGTVVSGVAASGAASSGTAVSGPRRMALLAWSAFAATALLSSAVNTIPPAQWLVAGKEYLWLACVPAAFALGALQPADLKALLRWAPAWLLLQLPVAAWQRFAVAPRRGGDSPWDAVVGLFGGHPTSGGGSGAMAIVSLIVAAWLLRRARAASAGGRLEVGRSEEGDLEAQHVRGGWPLAAAASAAVAALLSCALAEVKLVILLLPLLAVAVAWPLGSPGSIGPKAPSARQTPVVAALVVAGLLSLALAWAYQQQYAARGTREGDSLRGYAEAVLERNRDDALGADAYGQMSRLGALRHWAMSQHAADVPGWLIGHGMGSSRRGQWAVGELAQRTPFRLARSSAVLLLWEVGLLGLGALVLSFGAVAASAVSWAAAGPKASPAVVLADPTSPGTVDGPIVAAAFVIALLTLPYGTELFEAPQWPWLLGLTAGAWLSGGAGAERRVGEGMA